MSDFNFTADLISGMSAKLKEAYTENVEFQAGEGWTQKMVDEVAEECP